MANSDGETTLRWPAELKFVQDDASGVLDVSHVVDMTLPIFSDLAMVLLLCAAMTYLTNLERPKGDFPAFNVYKAGIQDINALRALF